MYTPLFNREDDPAVLHALMREHSFATLVTQGPDRAMASHLPLLLEEDRGKHGTLVGHMARANPQWQSFGDGAEILAIFLGPHAYVSPSWYETKLSVPTWNYAAVHAYGKPRLIENAEELRSLLARTVGTYEEGFERPWAFDLPGEYTDGMMRGIVGFEVEITRLEGKLKLSQNRSEADRQGVIKALSASSDHGSRAVAALMAAADEKRKGPVAADQRDKAD